MRDARWRCMVRDIFWCREGRFRARQANVKMESAFCAYYLLITSAQEFTKWENSFYDGSFSACELEPL